MIPIKNYQLRKLLNFIEFLVAEGRCVLYT